MEIGNLHLEVQIDENAIDGDPDYGKIEATACLTGPMDEMYSLVCWVELMLLGRDNSAAPYKIVKGWREKLHQTIEEVEIREKDNRGGNTR